MDSSPIHNMLQFICTFQWIMEFHEVSHGCKCCHENLCPTWLPPEAPSSIDPFEIERHDAGTQYRLPLPFHRSFALLSGEGYGYLYPWRRTYLPQYRNIGYTRAQDAQLSFLCRHPTPSHSLHQ